MQDTQDMKILVVDDLPSMCKVLRRQLKIKGFTNVTEALDINTAIEVLEKEQVSLVITDLHLNNVNADELLVRSKKLDPPIPVIVVTSDMDRDEFTRIKDLGVAAYLIKPFSSEELLEQMQKVIDLG